MYPLWVSLNDVLYFFVLKYHICYYGKRLPLDLFLCSPFIPLFFKLSADASMIDSQENKNYNTWHQSYYGSNIWLKIAEVKFSFSFKTCSFQELTVNKMFEHTV